MLKRTTNKWVMKKRRVMIMIQETIIDGYNAIENAMNNDLHNKELKRTESVMLSDPPCKDYNARFTTVTLKALF